MNSICEGSARVVRKLTVMNAAGECQRDVVRVVISTLDEEDRSDSYTSKVELSVSVRDRKSRIKHGSLGQDWAHLIDHDNIDRSLV